MMRKKRLIGENLLTNFNDFPARYRREASQAIATSFRHPEIASALSQIDRQKLIDTLVGVVGTREELMTTLDSVRYSDIVQTIIGVILDDAFYSSDGDFFEVEYNEGRDTESDTQKRVNEIIEDFIREFRLVNLVQHLMEDLLLYGEYPLRVVVSPNRNGIIEIKDDLDPISTIGVYEIDTPVFFLERSDKGYLVRTPKEVIHFNLSPTKVRIKTFDFHQNKKSIPEYIRIGRSVIYPALQKIKQLQTIELAATITDLKRAIAPVLVSIAVPANSQPEDVTEIIKKYEQHLQEVYRGMPDLENPSMGDLLATVTNFRAVPNFTDGKGTIQTLDLIGNQADIDNRIDRLRTAIAMAIGMPPYYLVTSQMETGQAQKTEMLKLHSRYARMLMSIQSAIANGIRRIIALHVINKGIYINDELIQIRFKSVIDVEHLDMMEYAVASAQTLRDIWAAIQDVLSSDEVPAKLNAPVFLKMVNMFLTAGSSDKQPLLLPITEEEMAAEQAAAAGGEAGGLAGGGGGGGGGDLFGGGGVEEAPMFEPAEGGGGEENIGDLAADAMANNAEVPPADFGPQAEEGAEEVPAEGAETEVPEEGGEENLGDFAP